MNKLKRTILILLCSAILLSAAGCSAPATSSSESEPTAKDTVSNEPLTDDTAANNTVSLSLAEPLSAVEYPAIPEDLDAMTAYYSENTPDEAFLASLISFSAKSSSHLLSEALKSVPGSNQTVSPLSLAYALGILGTAAGGESQKLVEKALEVPSMDQAAQEFGKLYRKLYQDKEDAKLKIANSIWLQKDFNLKEEFAANAAANFYASSWPADFSSEETANAMAKWISDNTGGTLNPSFQPDASLILSIINTVYFNYSWSNQFQAENNLTAPFHLPDGSTSDVTYMKQTASGINFEENEQFIQADLGFNGDWSMSFVLPKGENTPEQLIASPESLSTILTGTSDMYGDVVFQVPKFTFNSEFDLQSTLESMGLASLFGDTADFSNLTEERASLSSAKQETYISVDENGCEASAYTKMDIMRMSMGVEELPVVELTLDRPFLFIIRSTENLPLFIGVVNQPAE